MLIERRRQILDLTNQEQHADEANARKVEILNSVKGIGPVTVSAIALIGLSQIRNPWLFMGVLFLFAVIMEMYRPASSAMIGDVTAGDQRPHAFGLMYISVNLGFAVAPPIGGFLATHSL